MKKHLIFLLCPLLCLGLLAGCAEEAAPAAVTQSPAAVSPDMTESELFSARDLDVGYAESDAAVICFTQTGAQVTSYGTLPQEAVSITETTVTLTAAGTYVLSGENHNMQIIAALPDTEKAQLVLKDLSLTCRSGPAVRIDEADKIFLTLAEDSVNSLTDGEVYALAEGEDEPNACLYSKADLTINGTGSLTVTGNAHHGIFSKGDLTVTGGSITVTAAEDGIKGKDSLRIKAGVFMVTSGGDGLQSNNSEDARRGYVYIGGGSFTVDAQADGVQAETGLTIAGGSFDIRTGGGCGETALSRESFPGFDGTRSESLTEEEDTVSQKALKAGTALSVTGGSFTIDSCDDALHSDGSLYFSNADLMLRTGDDGLHAESDLVLDSGTVTVSTCYEGLEGSTVTINGGLIDIIAADDAINAAGGTDTGITAGFGGRESFTQGSSAYFVEINGGTIKVTAGGDGIDSNGSFTVNGGELYINGGENGGNGAFDFFLSAAANGGVTAAAGSSVMAMNFTEGSQCAAMYVFETTHPAGEPLSLLDRDGNVLVCFTPDISYSCVVVSHPQLEQGQLYTCTAGSETGEFTLTGSIWTNGSGMDGRIPGGQMGPGHMDGSQIQLPENFEPPEGGTMPQMPEDGTMPQMPEDGTMPQMPEDGTMPQMPEGGTMPQMPEGGTMPQMPEGGSRPAAPFSQPA